MYAAFLQFVEAMPPCVVGCHHSRTESGSTAFVMPGVFVEFAVFDFYNASMTMRTAGRSFDFIVHSLLTMFIKQALVMRETRDNKYRIFEPIEVIANLNTRMAQQNLSGCQFATCCYCLLNTETLQLTFARAGHPYPILIRPGQQPQQLQIRGPLLGIFEQAEFTQQTIQFRSGDKLFIYSDGADPLVGEIDDLSRFNFSKEFCDCIDLPVYEMIKELDGILANQQTNPAEFDDVTTIGLQIS